MRSRPIRAALLLLCLASPALAGAVELETLSGLMTEALSKHPGITAREREAEAAGAELSAARWGRYPTFSVDTQASSEGTGTLGRVEVPLWAGGRISGQIVLSRSGEEGARASLEEQRLELLQQVTEAYFDVLRLEQRVRIARENESEHSRLLEMIERRVSAEISPAADRTLASNRLHQARSERVMLERQLSQAVAGLEYLVDRPIGPLMPREALDFPETSTEALERAAVEFSPTRARLEAEARQSAAEIRLARAAAMPTLVLGHQEQLGDRDSNRFDSDSQTYLALRMQTGAGLSNRALLQAARSRQEAARAIIRDHEWELRRTVRTTWEEFQGLQQQLVWVQETLAGVDEMVDSYLRQFQVGKKSWLDVMNLQREKAQAHYAFADVKFALEAAKLKLLLLSGRVRADNLELLGE